MGINCSEEDDLDEVTHCELSDDELAVVITTDKLVQVEARKLCDECSVDIDKMGANNV